MFFILASLIALLTLAYLVASGFVRVVRYFWGWLSSGEKVDGAAGDTVSAVPQTAPFSKPKPTQAEFSAYLDTMHLGWYQVFLLKKSGCSLPLA